MKPQHLAPLLILMACDKPTGSPISEPPKTEVHRFGETSIIPPPNLRWEPTPTPASLTSNRERPAPISSYHIQYAGSGWWFQGRDSVQVIYWGLLINQTDVTIKSLVFYMNLYKSEAEQNDPHAIPYKCVYGPIGLADNRGYFHPVPDLPPRTKLNVHLVSEKFAPPKEANMQIFYRIGLIAPGR